MLARDRPLLYGEGYYMWTKRSPEDQNLTCYDVLGDVDAAIRSEIGDTDYYVVGGIVTGALKHPDSVIDPDSRTVFTTPDSAEPVRRPKGSLRDIDVVVKDTLTKDQAKRIKGEVAGAVGHNLVVAISGFDHHRSSALARPLGTFADWTSRRTIDEDGALRYELFPLERQVDAVSYEPWQLMIMRGRQMTQISMLHPAGHMLAYDLRSISGRRSKDGPKYTEMEERVKPLFEEEIQDGPFSAWRQFAEDIDTALTAGRRARVARSLGSGAVDLSVFRAKGRALAEAESHPKIVDIVQGPMHVVFDKFIGAT